MDLHDSYTGILIIGSTIVALGIFLFLTLHQGNVRRKARRHQSHVSDDNARMGEILKAAFIGIVVMLAVALVVFANLAGGHRA